VHTKPSGEGVRNANREIEKCTVAFFECLNGDLKF